MTALDKFDRLEGSGVWRQTPDAQLRDVIVSLGESSLVISDERSSAVLSHWSLPAVQRLTRGTNPAVYAPSPERDGETLEISEPLLIEALAKIHDALRPKPPLRWLRYTLIGGGVAVVIAGVLWLPDMLAERTARIVPNAMREHIGQVALDHVFDTGSDARLCADPAGRETLVVLRNRVLGSDWRLAVVAGVPELETAHLPGRLMVIGADLLERLDSAEALVGWMLREALAEQTSDPLLPALQFAGPRATLTLLTTGELPEGALQGYAVERLSQATPAPDPEALGRWLDALGVAPTAYAMSLPGSARELAQTLADRPTPEARPNTRVLSDGQWLTLQAICGG